MMYRVRGGGKARRGGAGREARSGFLTADNKRDLILSLIFQALLFIFSHTVGLLFFFIKQPFMCVSVRLWLPCGVRFFIIRNTFCTLIKHFS